MLTTDELDLLRSAVTAKFGSEIKDGVASEKLSIEIFLKTNHYVSRESNMRIFVNNPDGTPTHPNVFVFLSRPGKKHSFFETIVKFDLYFLVSLRC